MYNNKSLSSINTADETNPLLNTLPCQHSKLNYVQSKWTQIDTNDSINCSVFHENDEIIDLNAAINLKEFVAVINNDVRQNLCIECENIRLIAVSSFDEILGVYTDINGTYVSSESSVDAIFTFEHSDRNDLRVEINTKHPSVSFFSKKTKIASYTQSKELQIINYRHIPFDIDISSACTQHYLFYIFALILLIFAAYQSYIDLRSIIIFTNEYQYVLH